MNHMSARPPRLRGGFRLLVIAAFLASVVGLVALRATTVVAPTFTQLVNESDYIVRAVVKTVTAEWRDVQGHPRIYSLVELDVREVIAGKPPQPLILQVLGGKIGEQELVLEGAPKFVVGEENIYFIRGNGQNIYPLVAIMHGSYPVMKDSSTGREYMARSNHAPLADTAEVSQPMAEAPANTIGATGKKPSDALSPGEFVRRVKTAIDPTYRRVQQR